MSTKPERPIPAEQQMETLVRTLASVQLGPAATALLVTFVTGRECVEVDRSSGMRVASLTDATILPWLTFTAEQTLARVKDAIVRAYPKFNATRLAVYVPNRAEGGKLQEQKDDATKGADLMASGDTLFVVCTSAHEMEQTKQTNEYEVGDISCPCCGMKGPNIKTSHRHCKTCKLCGNCCIDNVRCGADYVKKPQPTFRVEHGPDGPKVTFDPPAQPPTPRTPDQEAAALVLLNEFYEWQRNVMKPY